MKLKVPNLLFYCLVSVLLNGYQPLEAQSSALKINNLSDLFSNDIVATGKDLEINRSELDKAIITTKANRVSQGNPIPPHLNDKVEAQILDKLITTKILLNKATKEQKRKGELNAKSFLEDLIRQHPSKETFERQLLSTGMDLEYFKDQVTEQAIVKEVIDTDLKANYIVTSEKAREFYEDNKEVFAIPERAELRNIYIPTRSKLTGEPLSSDEKTKRLIGAKEAQKKASSGEDFIKLVETYSEDAVTKANQGQVTRAKGSNNPTLEEAVFALHEGQVSTVINTGSGYHVVKLIKKLPKGYQPFSEVSERINLQLEAENVEKLLPEYLDKLKREANIEIRLD